MSITELGTRLFFSISHLRFCTPGQNALRLSPRCFWSLNFALLQSRFRSPVLLDFRSLFVLFDFTLLDFYTPNFVLLRLYTARIGQAEQDRQNRTGRTGQAEQTGGTEQAEQDSRTGQQNRTAEQDS